MSDRTLTITHRYLEHHEACEEQLDDFHGRFGDQAVEVTEELAAEHATVFDWSWAISYLIDEDVRRAAQSEECDAYLVRIRAREEIEDAYDQKATHTHEEMKERLARMREIRARYQRQVAGVFARHFIAQGGRELFPGEPRPTSNGVELTDEVLDALAEQAEEGFEVESLRPRGAASRKNP
jgi:hypothetical protein